MNCPTHNEKIRREWDEDGKSVGFCDKCLKHYRACDSIRHMARCELIYGHQGSHTDYRGDHWTDSDTD